MNLQCLYNPFNKIDKVRSKFSDPIVHDCPMARADFAPRSL